MLLLSLVVLLAAPVSETALGKGFGDVAFAGEVPIIASADGTVRTVNGDRVDIVFTTGRKMVGVAVSEDGRRVAVVGAGVVARSDDGGNIFRVEPLPDDTMAYAAAFVANTLLVFDKDGRGFRSIRSGKFEPMPLPVKTRYWTASFEGETGWVVGENGVLISTRDGGRSWRQHKPPIQWLQGVLLHKGRVFISGERGVWSSADGETFHHVLQLPGDKGDCIRMAKSGDLMAVACTPLGHTLFKSNDGEHFQEVAAPQSANMVGVAVNTRGDIIAVGAYELVLRASDRAGTLLYHSEESRKWLHVLKLLEAEKLAKKTPFVESKARKPGPDARVIQGVVETEGGGRARDVEVRLLSGQRTRTDREGRFRFKPTNAYADTLAVDVEGFAPLRRDVTVDAYGALTVELELRRAVPLAGRLVSPRSEPIAASLRVFAAPPPDAERARYAERAAPISETTAAADGSFSISGVSPGEYLLEVRPHGLQPFTTLVTAPNAALKLLLTEGARVTGRFFDEDGKPLRGATVVMRARGHASEAAGATVDASGQFELAGLPDGELSLEATALERRICLRREVTVSAGAAVDVVLRLGRAPSITGRVVDDSGAPVPLAMVMGTTTADPLCGARVTEADNSGEFVLEDVADGEYSISAVIIGAKIKSGRAFSEAHARPGQRVTVKVTR